MPDIPPNSLLAFLKNPAWRGVWLGLACALAAWLLSQMAVLRGLEDWLFDGWFFTRGTRPTQAHIVLIGLDEASLDELGKPFVYLSPELAEVVAHAHQQGAAAIGIDLFIPEKLSTLPDIETPGRPGDARPVG